MEIWSIWCFLWQTFLHFFVRNKILFFSLLSISPSWECRIKISALPIQTLPSSSKQKSIQASLCQNVQRNCVPGVGSLSVSILGYIDLRIYPSDSIKAKAFFVHWDCSLYAKLCGLIHFYSFKYSWCICLCLNVKEGLLAPGSYWSLHTNVVVHREYHFPYSRCWGAEVVRSPEQHIEKSLINSLQWSWSQEQRIPTVNQTLRSSEDRQYIHGKLFP